MLTWAQFLQCESYAEAIRHIHLALDVIESDPASCRLCASLHVVLGHRRVVVSSMTMNNERSLFIVWLPHRRQ